MAAQRRPEAVLRADQEDVEIRDLPQRPQGTFHLDAGGVIAPHGIQRDPHGHGWRLPPLSQAFQKLLHSGGEIDLPAHELIHQPIQAGAAHPLGDASP